MIKLIHRMFRVLYKYCRNFEFVGVKGRGRGRKTSGGCVNMDFSGLSWELEMDEVI